MKKKIGLLMLCGVVLLGLCGCGNNNDNIKKFTAVDKSIFPFDTIDTEQQFFDVLSESNNIVLAVRDICEYSKKLSPIVKEIADTYNFKVYTLNIDSLENGTLSNKNSGEVIIIETTPVLFIKGKNNTTERIDSFHEKEELINILQTKNIIEDKRTPKEKFINAIIKHDYRDNGDNTYSSFFGNTAYKIDLNNHVYTSASDDGSILNGFQYYYLSDKVHATIKYGNIIIEIDYIPSTGQWYCNSNFSDGCNENIISNYINISQRHAETFNSYLGEAGITANDLSN